jgi:TolB protein
VVRRRVPRDFVVESRRGTGVIRPAFGALRVVLLVGGVALLGSASPVAQAAFPGSNGRIAFERDAPAGDHTQTDAFTVRADGTDVVRLTRTPGRNELGPTWSPDGRRLAFWRSPAPFGSGSLWVMRANGSGQRRLTDRIDARDPAWNPVGTRLVFTRFGRGSSDLYTLRASDGGATRQLTSTPSREFEPAWAPDGHRIAFTRAFSSGDPGDIYVLNLNTHRVRQITDSPAYDHQVAWSPDGSRLVFERHRVTSSSVCRIRPDGTGLQRVTTGPHFDIGPAYSPDGLLIAFGSDRKETFFSNLWTVRPDGTQLHRLLRLRFSEGFPDWQPLS